MVGVAPGTKPFGLPWLFIRGVGVEDMLRAGIAWFMTGVPCTRCGVDVRLRF